MKKIFTKKVINAIAAAGLLFAVLSCSNSVKSQTDGLEIEQKNEGVALRINVSELLANNQASAKNTESVTKADSKARTLTPDVSSFNLSNLTDVVFSGAIAGETPKKIKSFDSIADLEAAQIIVPFDSTLNDWDFTISANYGDVGFYGKTTAKLSYDSENGQTNTLNFALYLSELGSGNGSFSFTFKLPEIDDSNYTSSENGRVTKAVAQLFDIQGTVVKIDGEDEVIYGIEDSAENKIENHRLVFSAADIPAGNYRAKVNFYFEDDNAEVAYWQEVIQVAEGFTSTAERTIEHTEKFYRITYNLNGGDEDDFDPDVAFVPGDRDYNINKFTPTKGKYIFIGWYTDSSLTTPFTFPLEKDAEVWARWESLEIPADHSYYPATNDTVLSVISQIIEDAGNGTIQASLSEPAVLKVLGEVNWNIAGYIPIDFNNNCYIKLDLSNTRGLDYIGSSAFQGEKNLVEIILPDSVSSIYDSAFQRCSNLSAVTIGAGTYNVGELAFAGTNLKTITLSNKNTDLKVVDNVLYSADGEKLFAYPVGSDATSFTIPSSVSFIEYGAFNGVKNLTIVTAADTTASWYLNGYYNPDAEDLIRKSEKCEPLTIADLANGGGYRIHKLTKDECDDYLEEFFGDTSKFGKVMVYTSQSTDLSDGTFTEATADKNEYKFFKIKTTPGAKYTIDFCASNWKSQFNNVPDDLYLTNPYLYIFSTDGKEIDCVSYTSTSGDFTAVGNITYLGIYNDKEASGCAFHVWEHEVKTGITVTVDPLSDDIEVVIDTLQSHSSGTPDLLNFNVKGNVSYDSYKWYLDDVNNTYFDGYTNFSVTLGDNLSSGAHTVMLIATKDGKYYSYTAQIWKD